MKEHDVFDRWLEDRLRSALDPVVARGARSVRPRYRMAAGGRFRGISVLGGASGALGLKVATGLTVAAFAAAATGTALSGTPNPAAWGTQVSEKVQACQNDLSADPGAIGGCVSAFARQNGEAQQLAHEPSPEPTAAGRASGARNEHSPSPRPSSTHDAEGSKHTPEGPKQTPDVRPSHTPQPRPSHSPDGEDGGSG